MIANLELYRIFSKVAFTENISKAADELYVSQSAVSKSIKNLELLCGFNLFSRNYNGVKLTPEGEIILKYIEPAFNSLDSAEQMIMKIRENKTGIIKIGISNTLCKHFLMPYLQLFIEDYPYININVMNNTANETITHLQEGLIDFGIISNHDNMDNFHITKLFDIQDTFVTNKDIFEDYSNKPKNFFSGMPLMLLGKDNATRQYMNTYIETLNSTFKTVIEISEMDLLIEFAKNSFGVASVIRQFIEDELNHKELFEIPNIQLPPMRQISLIVHKSFPLSIASQTFIDFIENALNLK